MISASSFLTAAVTLVVGVLAWRRRQRPGLAGLALCMFGSSLWALCWSLEQLVAAPFWKLQVLKGQDLGICIAILAALDFAWQYPQPLGPITRTQRALVAAPLGLCLLLLWTNDLHHLMYAGTTPSATSSDGVNYLWGPLFYVYVACCFLLMLAAVTILTWKSLHSRAGQRGRLVLTIGSLCLPMAAYVLYLVAPISLTTEELVPLSFAFCGLLLATTVFADLEQNVREHSVALQRTVTALQTEIAQRAGLDAELREAKATLAQRLAEQSRRLTALYDVILLGSAPMGDDIGADANTTTAAVNRIRALTGAQAAAFYRQAEGGLHLETAAGSTPPGQAAPTRLPLGWLPPDGELIAVSDEADLRLPAALHDSGAVLARALLLPEQEPGALICLWPPGHGLSVEDIALFDAACDLLTVILENERLRRLADAEASRSERRRLARDLHDSVTQSLHALTLSADTARSLAGEAAAPNLARVLDHLKRSAQQALKEMRLLLYELRFVALEDFDLVEALRQRLDAVERRAGLDAVLSVERTVAWPAAWDSELYPLALEALNNALKYARASRIEVSLCSQPTEFTLLVRDDGRGFDPAFVETSGIGQASMAERAARLGGSLRIESAPGHGAGVRLTIARRAP